MVRKLNFKMLVIIAVLSIILSMITVEKLPGFDKNRINLSNISLPFGWQPIPDENACEASNTGSPFLDSDSNPDCATREVNNLASFLDTSLALDALILTIIYFDVLVLIVSCHKAGRRSLIRQ